MYSQIANVAKVAAHQQQGVQLSEAMQQADVVRRNEEQSRRVNQTEGESKSSTVDQNGSRQGAAPDGRRGSDGGRSDGEPPAEQGRLKEPYLGRHIDITR